MKVKNYIYARLLTVLLSTSALAGMAVTEKDGLLNFEEDFTSAARPVAVKEAEDVAALKAQVLGGAAPSLLPKEEDSSKPVAVRAVMDSPSDSDDREATRFSTASPLEPLEIEDTDSSAKIAGFTLQNVRGFAELSELAYTDPENRRRLAAKYRAAGYQIEYFSTDAENSGVVLLKGRKVIVAYHGTESMRNLATDFWCQPRTSSFTYGRFHQGFYAGFLKTWDEIATIIDTHARRNGYNLADLEVTFTGHSLGGALAGIGAIRWAEKVNAQNVSLINFGGPRFCDTKAARRIEQLFGERILRVTQHGYDIVPGVGPGIMGYEHVGQNLRIYAENWTDMHLMSAYRRLVNQIKVEEFKADNSERFIYQGGWFNPLNIMTDTIKYGVHEGVLGNVQMVTAGVMRAIFSTTEKIEDALTKETATWTLHIQSVKQRHYRKNIELLTQDNMKIEQENQKLREQANMGDSEAAQKLQENERVYNQNLQDIQAFQSALAQL